MTDPTLRADIVSAIARTRTEWFSGNRGIATKRNIDESYADAILAVIPVDPPEAVIEPHSEEADLIIEALWLWGKENPKAYDRCDALARRIGLTGLDAVAATGEGEE